MSWMIKWEDTIDHDSAENPKEAAQVALDAIQNGETLAFSVINTETRELFTIDLSEEEDEAVLQATGGETRYDVMLDEIAANTEWLSTTTNDEVECIGIENLKGILTKYFPDIKPIIDAKSTPDNT